MRKRFLIGIIASVVALVGIGVGTFTVHNIEEERKWQRICDGISVIEQCSDEEGNRYSKYVYHEAEPEVTKEVVHPAVPAKTHVVNHPAEYGTRQVPVCIKTSISYKSGSCALSRCRDGSYSGSTGRGTCSYHGGVWYSGGPWYEYVSEQYLIHEAWTETVIDEPAKEAWMETVVVKAATEAWTEKKMVKK